MTALAVIEGGADPDRVGVALSAGSAAAMAEIGALEVLAEHDVPVDCVAGTSGGAIVGAACAAERLPELRACLESITPGGVLRLFDPVWPRAGLIEGQRGMEWIAPHLGETIESLPRAFAAVATDVHSGEEVILSCGPVADAVRASIAFPGIFTPWPVGGRSLVDGGLVDPLPVHAARTIGADFVIAINVLPLRERAAVRDPDAPAPLVAVPTDGRPAPTAPRSPHRASPGLLDVLAQSSRIMASELARLRLRAHPPDFMIQIPVPTIGMFDVHRTAELVRCGREAALAALPELQAALASRGRGAAGSRPRRRTLRPVEGGHGDDLNSRSA